MDISELFSLSESEKKGIFEDILKRANQQQWSVMEKHKMKGDKCYRDWRRSEAYMVPMTEAGLKKAEERYEEFKRGWKYGIKCTIFHLEQMHKQNKDTHKFYFLAAEQMRELIK